MKTFLACALLLLAGTPAAPARVVAQEKRAPVYYFNPDWSPDGNEIAFESTRDGKHAVYVVRADGSGLRKLTSGEASDEQPRWSPDGKRIVFISQRDKHLQLYVMDADGPRQRRLTNGDDIDYQPMFSPRGDWVAFISRREQASVVHAIYAIRADGTGRKLLSDESANDTEPRWSPNGKKILFMRSAVIKKYYREMSKEELAQMRSSTEVFVMNSDGSSVKNLTNSPARDCCAYWSRDGKTIYFLSERDGAPQIYAMKPDGSKPRRVADGRVVTDPNISPDGKKFVYTKEASGKWGLYVYELKSGRERLVVGG
jgi:TolB protein